MVLIFTIYYKVITYKKRFPLYHTHTKQNANTCKIYMHNNDNYCFTTNNTKIYKKFSTGTTSIYTY